MAALPAMAQERPPSGSDARYWPGSVTLGGNSTSGSWVRPVDGMTRADRIAAAGGGNPGPMRYDFTKTAADRAVVRVKFSRGADLAALNQALGASIAREVSEAGYGRARVVGRDCSRISEGEFSRQCEIALRLRR
ncbi:hypothetical protein [Sphingomonas sp.]|uniref:hypothetical protein n=1 Tax=Sphingomonas sp. TaxID=28214 RepID=UPI001ED20FEA|nr:hypothetical protein [Sphingomonas sp.]MBX3594339.1 hypothetical protein [Sphingomonas sp.]